MIYYFGDAYDLKGNIAEAYNRHIDLVPNDEDWCVVADADFMFLTPRYGEVISEYLRRYPEYTLWTVYTNRVKCRPQLIKEMFFEDRMSKHREKAVELYENKRYSVKRLHRVISGYVMIFKKKDWKRLGKFRGEGLYGIDTRFSRDVLIRGERIGLMEAVYGMHYYRFNDGIKFNPYQSKKRQKG